MRRLAGPNKPFRRRPCPFQPAVADINQQLHGCGRKVTSPEKTGVSTLLTSTNRAPSSAIPRATPLNICEPLVTVTGLAEQVIPRTPTRCKSGKAGAGKFSQGYGATRSTDTPPVDCGKLPRQERGHQACRRQAATIGIDFGAQTRRCSTFTPIPINNAQRATRLTGNIHQNTAEFATFGHYVIWPLQLHGIRRDKPASAPRPRQHQSPAPMPPGPGARPHSTRRPTGINHAPGEKTSAGRGGHAPPIDTRRYRPASARPPAPALRPGARSST